MEVEQFRARIVSKHRDEYRPESVILFGSSDHGTTDNGHLLTTTVIDTAFPTRIRKISDWHRL